MKSIHYVALFQVSDFVSGQDILRVSVPVCTPLQKSSYKGTVEIPMCIVSTGKTVAYLNLAAS
jgi:hypothetical protein